MLVQNIKLGTIATTIAFAGLLTFGNGTTYAQGGPRINSPEQRPAATQPASEDGRGRGGSSWLTGEEKQALIADVLGMSVEDLAAAKEAGQSMDEIVEAQGLTEEEFDAEKDAAMIAAVNQAVADGELTQEEADAIIERIENGGKGDGHRGHGHREHGHRGNSNWLTGEEKEALKANVLDMSVEELIAAKEGGQSFSEIVEAQGMTLEEFRTDLESALIIVVNQAVVDGELTQEQADRIIEHIENDKGHRGSDDDASETEDADASADEDSEVQALSILSFASSVTEVTRTSQTVQVFMPIVMR